MAKQVVKIEGTCENTGRPWSPHDCRHWCKTCRRLDYRIDLVRKQRNAEEATIKRRNTLIRL